MLEIIQKAAMSYEKTTLAFIEELTKVGQPFYIVINIDETWQELFNSQKISINGLIEFDLFISKENTIDVFLDKHNNINYFNFIFREENILNDLEKIKFKIPIKNILRVVIDDGLYHNYIANPVYVKPLSLSQKDIKEFKNI